MENLENQDLAIQASPNNPPWNTWIALAMWLLSVIFIAITPILFLTPYLASSGMFSRQGPELAQFLATDQSAILLQMVAIVPAHLFTMIFAWLIVTNRGRYSFKETLGFKSGGIRWWHHVLIFVAFAAFAAIVSNYIPETENELTRILKSSRAAVFAVALIATFTAPLVEEVVYRGIVYSALQRAAGVPASVVIVTLLFSSVHVLQYYESPGVIFLLTVLSLILTLMRMYSGNLLPCIIFHTIVNGVQSVGLLIEPYVDHASDQNTATFLHLIK